MSAVSRRDFMSYFAYGALTVACLSTTACSSSEAPSKMEAIRNRGKLACGVKKDVLGYGMLNTETGMYEGFEIDLCYQVAARVFDISYEQAKQASLCEFIDVTPKTRGPLLDNSTLDLVCATYTITPIRKTDYDFSVPYRIDHVGILIRRDSHINKMEDLDGKRIGISQGSTTKKHVEAMFADRGITSHPYFDEYPDYPSINASLDAGQIDAFAMDRSTLKTYASSSKELLQPEIQFGDQEYGIATKKNSDLSPVVNEVVQELLGNGWIDQEIADWELL